MRFAPRAMLERAAPWLAAGSGGFVLAYAIVAFFVFPASSRRTDATVPNVNGLPLDQAKQVLVDSGFVPQRGEQRYDNTVPAGTVLAQTPSPNTVLPRGGRVLLDLSRGQRTVEVPTITGLTQAQAELTLTNSGLDLGDVVRWTVRRRAARCSTRSPPRGCGCPRRARSASRSAPGRDS